MYLHCWTSKYRKTTLHFSVVSFFFFHSRDLLYTAGILYCLMSELAYRHTWLWYTVCSRAGVGPETEDAHAPKETAWVGVPAAFLPAASCRYGSWQGAMMAKWLGEKTWMGFRDPGFGISWGIVSHIWEVNQKIGTLAVSLHLKNK